MASQPPPQVPNMGFPPPPAQRSGSWIKWVLIGGGGCLVLLIVLLVGMGGCLAAMSGGGGGGGGDDAAAPEGYEAQKAEAVPIGETVEVGDVAWTVNSAQRATEIKSFGSREQGNFVLVDVTFINNGSESVTLDTVSLTVIDDQNRASEADSSLGVQGGDELFLEQVNPGVTKQGTAAFEVAPDAQGLILQLGDADMFGDQLAYVNLDL